LNAATVRLLDIPRVVNQIASLERRTARGDRDSIDHPPNHRDDLANVVAGVSAITLSKWRRGEFSVSIIQSDGRVVPYRHPSERVGRAQGRSPPNRGGRLEKMGRQTIRLNFLSSSNDGVK